MVYQIWLNMSCRNPDIKASIAPLKIIRGEVVPVNAGVAPEDAPDAVEVEDGPAEVEGNNRLNQEKKPVLKWRSFSLSFLFPTDTQIELL